MEGGGEKGRGGEEEREKEGGKGEREGRGEKEALINSNHAGMGKELQGP